MQIQTESSSPSGAVPLLGAWDSALVDRAICHGFIGRGGGVSVGPFASMNLSYLVGDAREAVDKNWARIRAQLPQLKALALSNQVHGNAVRVVTRESASFKPNADGMVTPTADGMVTPTADGMVTKEQGVILGIFTADCVPILMVDPKRKIASALHAGWRGVLAGIGNEGVRAMTNLGAHPRDILASLGPSIGLCCFEVDAELADRFKPANHSAQMHTRAGRPGKAYLDLRAIVKDQLQRAGLASDRITNVGPCTRCASDRFFSRRAAGGAVTGLQLSFVGFAG